MRQGEAVSERAPGSGHSALGPSMGQPSSCPALRQPSTAAWAASVHFTGSPCARAAPAVLGLLQAGIT